MSDVAAPIIGLIRRSVYAASIMLAAISSVHAADAELGRYLAAECMTCHRSATATSTIPNIFGLSEAHLNEVIRAYRAKTLPNPVMQNIASRLIHRPHGEFEDFLALNPDAVIPGRD